VKIAEDGVKEFKAEGVEVIIVDTSGRHKQQADLFEEMEMVSDAVQPDDVVFVMDSTIGQAVHDQATAFKNSVAVGSVIITKLDGHAKGGGALSAVAATESPITFIGEGEHFDDLEAFDARSFVSRMLGMGDVQGLYHKIKDNIGLDNQPEMLEKFKKGVFTLRDMYEQFQNVMKLGNIGNVMSMIPGMANMIPKGQEKDGSNRIQKFLTIMDSMTAAELDGEGSVMMAPDRIRRVSRGAGVDEGLIHQLLTTHKQFEKMVGKMGKTGLMKGDDALNRNLQRNPKAVMAQVRRHEAGKRQSERETETERKRQKETQREQCMCMGAAEAVF
jgi:signal recognition particle subunit SRP54